MKHIESHFRYSFDSANKLFYEIFHNSTFVLFFTNCAIFWFEVHKIDEIKSLYYINQSIC